MLMRAAAGKLQVEARRLDTAGGGGGLSGGTALWSIPTPIGQWFTIVLGIKQSDIRIAKDYATAAPESY